jgi:hypothetical protein
MARLADALVDDDRLFWEIQRRYETRPMVCGAYLALAGPPDRARLQALLLAATQAHPRLGCRLVDGSGGPRWQPHADDHATSPLVTWEHDASLHDHAGFLERAASRMNDRLPPDGLPWQCRIVSDRPEGDPHGCVHGIWLRWQHSLTDGEGMLDLLAALCAAPDSGPCGDLRARSPALTGDRKPVLAEDTRWTRRAGLTELLRQRRAAARGRRPHTHPGSSAVEIRRLELPLRHEQLLALAARHNVSTNDVVLSLSAWVIERHQQRATAGEPGVTAVLSPVSRRRAAEGVVLGNHSRALRLVLDPLPRDPFARIETVGALSAAAMASARPIPYWVYAALFRLPRPVLDRVLASAPPYISNYLPWADRPQRIAGQAITALHGFTPLLPHHGCTFAYGAHAGQVTCALTTDPSIVTDAAAMASLLEEAAHALVRESA